MGSSEEILSIHKRVYSILNTICIFQNTTNCMFASHNHKGRRGRDHMVVGFLTTDAISDSGSWRGVLWDP